MKAPSDPLPLRDPAAGASDELRAMLDACAAAAPDAALIERLARRLQIEEEPSAVAAHAPSIVAPGAPPRPSERAGAPPRRPIPRLGRALPVALAGAAALALAVLALRSRAPGPLPGGLRGGVPCVPLPAGLLHRWPFDETRGAVAADVAGSPAGDGAYVGRGSHAPAPGPGRVNGGLCFDGDGDHVSVHDPREADLADHDFTIDLWVKTTTAAGVTPILDKRERGAVGPRGYMLFLYDGHVGLQMADGVVPPGSAGQGFSNWVTRTAPFFVADGAFHLVAVTVQRSPSFVVTLYVDGATQPFTSEPRGSVSSAAPLTVGHSAYDATYFAGCVDEIEIFGAALPPSALDALRPAGGHCR